MTPLNLLISCFPQVWESCSCADAKQDAKQDANEGYCYRVKAYRSLFTLHKPFRLEA